jgi:aspartyl-tRNA(Asn)/glutamyl-tRNA(Gln) amidotransferase subunit C
MAALANIPITEQEEVQLAAAFTETITLVEKLSSLDTEDVEPTHQVTGLENVWREDTVNSEKMFSQDQALANAPQTHEGFFVVPQVINQDANA